MCASSVINCASYLRMKGFLTVLCFWSDWRHQNCREVFPRSGKSLSGKREGCDTGHLCFNEQVRLKNSCVLCSPELIFHLFLITFYCFFPERAFVYLSQNNYAEAHTCFSSILKIDPKNPVVNTWCIFCHYLSRLLIEFLFLRFRLVCFY